MIKKIITNITNKIDKTKSAFTSRLDKLTEKYGVLGFIKGVIKRSKDDQVNRLSAQITYYLILALFPFMIFLLNLVMYFDIDKKTIMDTISLIIPVQSSSMVFNIINEVFTSSGVTLLSIGMFTALWSASKGVNALIRGLNKAYDVEEQRFYLLVKAIGILATIGIPIMILVSFLFLVLGDQIGQFISNLLGLSEYLVLWEILRVFIPLSSMTLYFTLFYKWAPNRHIKLKHAVVGSVFSMIGWIGISMLFSFYVSQFGNYAKVYGTLGGIIVLILWLNISSTILIIGGEINAELAKPYKERA